jgi:PKD repeat protein
MKQTFFLKLLVAIVFLASSCRKEQYRAPNISGVGTDTIVLNLGDKMVLAPNITNLKGNDYTWSVNGKQMVSGQVNYTFEATTSGNFEVTFKVNNKGGEDQQSFKILVEKPIAISIDDQAAVAMCTVVDITPSVTGPDRTDYEYEWAIGDSVIGKKRHLSFISSEAGVYELRLRATAGKQTATAIRTITVKAAQYVKNAYMVLAYAPAPAKNHNWSIIGDAESWEFGDEHPLPYNEFLVQVTALRKDNAYNSLVLGSWGGSATFQFDHTVANAPGKPDLELTATYSKADLPAVYVAYDGNKNGKPDEDEWYEIKNDDYGIEDLPDYEMTFTYNKTVTDDKRVYSYFNWKDNQATPAQGEIVTNKTFASSMTLDGVFSTRGFFPGLNMIDFPSKKLAILDGWKSSFTRKGKRITKNVTGAAPFSQKLNVDIDMAVNKKGEPVQLPGIDFVRVVKTVYPFQQDFINAGGAMTDFNMDEKRMLHVGGILDKNLKN